MVEKRKCNKCKIEYDIGCFDIANSKTGHYRKECKYCRAEKNKKYYKTVVKELEQTDSDSEEMKQNEKIFKEVFGKKLT